MQIQQGIYLGLRKCAKSPNVAVEMCKHPTKSLQASYEVVARSWQPGAEGSAVLGVPCQMEGALNDTQQEESSTKDTQVRILQEQQQQ